MLGGVKVPRHKYIHFQLTQGCTQGPFSLLTQLAGALFSCCCPPPVGLNISRVSHSEPALLIKVRGARLHKEKLVLLWLSHISDDKEHRAKPYVDRKISLKGKRLGLTD